MHYVVRRLLAVVPILLGVSVLVFGLTRVAPTDSALLLLGMDATEQDIDQLRHLLKLDRPLPEQYLIWLRGAVQGDFGRSYIYGNPVTEELAARFPATLLLAFSALLVTVVVGIPLGILSAVKQGQWADQVALIGSLIGVSVPKFLFGFLFIWMLSYRLPLFPTGGAGSLRHLVLPALTLGLPTAAVVMRLTRASMLEVLRQDYVRTARGKGLQENVVLVRHALKNALIPVITVLGLQFGFLLSGSVVTEQVFAWPGIGSLLVNAATLGDYPVVQGATILLTVMFIAVNLAVDLAYGMLDVRVRLGEARR
jgi:ABC-type dipeptide/oligopeptide/nickel transport system permease component